MAWLEYLDRAGQPLVFKAAAKLFPGWDHWFKPLAKASKLRRGR